MEEELKSVGEWLKVAVALANSVADIENIRVQTLGRKGRLTVLLRKLGSLPSNVRSQYGEAVNNLKKTAITLIHERLAYLKETELEASLTIEQVDISLPTRPELVGYIHPISYTIDTITSIFSDIGFILKEGPDVEDDFHNFTALNIPQEHPARQMHDTFYLPEQNGSRFLLRTHTSPVQIRTMQEAQPPFRIIAPGRTYRRDSDTTHTPMFHQVEGFVVDREIHLGHLKGCITTFIHSWFNSTDVPIRFRSSFFPFTEPSAEVDIGCSWKDGVLTLGMEGWLEIMGCGMIHPEVFHSCQLDPECWQGFAFGMGVERLAMLKYGITDLRTFYEPDLRWLHHYGLSPLDG